MREKEFFIELQNELIEDREKEDCQADPIYYGIRDVETLPALDDNSDGIVIYDKDACECIPIGDFLADEVANNEDWVQDEFVGFSMDETGNIKITDWDNLIDEIRENCSNVEVLPVQEFSYIRRDALFLTRKDAEIHLKANRHHYSGEACTYAMTAFRSPRYEKLLKVIKCIDWKNSEIKLLENEK